MDLDPNEQKAGFAWLYGAGLFAVILTLVLFRIDNRLSTSDYDSKLGAALHELRSAQAGLPSRSLDARVYVRSAVAADSADAHDE